MSVTIEKYLRDKDVERALQACIDENQFYTGLFIANLLPQSTERYHQLLAEIIKNADITKAEIKLVKRDDIKDPNVVPSSNVVRKNSDSKIRVKLMCSWMPSEDLVRVWNKMTKGNFIWNNIELVWTDTADYYVIINAVPPGIPFDKKKTIVFRMEPKMSIHPEIWREWADPKDEEFLRVFRHEKGDYNNNEWHLSKTYTQLCNEEIVKNPDYTNILSTVLSAQYRDPGHVKRIDFVKFLEKKGLTVHVYGDNKWTYKNYKGSLPKYCKDDGILPYKYTFNAENNSIHNYYTEKLIDGILGECLTFYWGCPNVKEFIDERAYVQLSLSNFEQDYETIRKAIQDDWYTERLPYIREAKKKILNELQFMPRLEKCINELKDKTFTT